MNAPFAVNTLESVVRCGSSATSVKTGTMQNVLELVITQITLITMYRIAGKFGGDLNLAVWRLKHEPPNLIPPIFCHDVIDVGVWERSRTSSSS